MFNELLDKLAPYPLEFCVITILVAALVFFINVWLPVVVLILAALVCLAEVRHLR